LGLGILAAWAWKSPAPGDGPLTADVRPVSRPVSPAAAPGALIVGQVTGAAGCQWAEPGEAVAAGSAVPLGRQFGLKSGTLEITYLVGERVILRGPAKYQALWPNGGMLWKGKLTAFAMNPAWTQPARPPDGSPWPRRQSPGDGLPAAAWDRQHFALDPVNGFPIPKFSFFIRTPSTLAISQSAQFELSVDASGATQTQLVLGMIEAWYPGGGKRDDVIGSTAREAWSCVGFNVAHDVWVASGTGRAPELMRSVFADAGAPDRAWFCGPPGNRMLRIGALQRPEPRATAGALPTRQHERTTN
jgi:hypothetical protein